MRRDPGLPLITLNQAVKEDDDDEDDDDEDDDDDGGTEGGV